jgi:alpha-tubulin suppressor-like RCC1 family protein
LNIQHFCLRDFTDLQQRLHVTEDENKETYSNNEVDTDDEDCSSLPPFVNVLTLPHAVDFPVMSGDVQVSKVAAGSRHTVALLEDGCVFTWGWNEYGQLGLGDNVSRDSPTSVELFSNGGIRITDVFAGWWNTLFVAE